MHYSAKLYGLLVILILSFPQMTFASWGFNEFGDQNNSPKLKITCDSKDSYCSQICNNESSCEIRQTACRDCIGTSLLMTNIFEDMGISYRSTNEIVSNYELVDFLQLGLFVTFSSKSIYNQTDSYDSDGLRAKFLSLCPLNAENSLVFFSLKNKTRVIDEVKYVICDGVVFKMSDDPDIILNESIYLK